jgi:hypothetical protein
MVATAGHHDQHPPPAPPQAASGYDVHNTCITTRRHSKVLSGTQRHTVSAAQRSDLHVPFALTRRRSGVRLPQRPLTKPQVRWRFRPLGAAASRSGGRRGDGWGTFPARHPPDDAPPRRSDRARRRWPRRVHRTGGRSAPSSPASGARSARRSRGAWCPGSRPRSMRPSGASRGSSPSPVARRDRRRRRPRSPARQLGVHVPRRRRRAPATFSTDARECIACGYEIVVHRCGVCHVARGAAGRVR